MKILNEEAVLVCNHELGKVANQPSQDLVRIAGKRVLVEKDPEGRRIAGCPNVNPLIGILACTATLVVQTGYSDLLKVDGKRVCLDTVTGFTNGTPPGVVKYKVNLPGQELVTELG